MVENGGEPPLYHLIQKFDLLNQNVVEEELSLTKPLLDNLYIT